MSASREKKKRQEFVAGGGVDAKAAREAQQKAANKRSNILYASVAVAFVVVAVFLFVYNSGILQRGSTALTIDGEKYTAGDVSYYYNNAYQNFLSQNGQIASLIIDPNKSLKDQMAIGSEDQTWDDIFKEQAVSSMKTVHAMVKAAEAEGMKLDEEDLKSFDASMEALKAAASTNGHTYKSYLTAVYGKFMTPAVYEKNLKASMLANKYTLAHQDSLSFTDDEIQAFYEENKNSYDLVDGGYVSISGAPETKKDDEGNTIEATEEEKSAAMDAAMEKAEAILAAYEKSGDLSAAAEENDATATVSTEIKYTAGTAGDWLFDEARKAGDAEVVSDENSSYVYVAVFNDRRRDETPDYNVRHILVTEANLELAEGAEATDKQILTEAEAILAGWDGTEDGFAKLAEEKSQDSGSNTNGGLYENVQKGQMVTEFNDWCYAEGRKAGDTAIVESQFGQHIMYFVGYGQDQYWHFAAENKLLNNAMNEWTASMTENVTAETQSGMNSVGR